MNLNSYCQNNLNAKSRKLWSFTSDFLLLYENVYIDGINKFSHVIVMFSISFLKLKEVCKKSSQFQTYLSLMEEYIFVWTRSWTSSRNVAVRHVFLSRLSPWVMYWGTGEKQSWWQLLLQVYVVTDTDYSNFRCFCFLQSGQFSEDMIPTVGFNMRKVTKGNVTIKVRHLVMLHFSC